MKKYNLPTRKQCFDIIRKFKLPSHIVAHSLAVAKLAVFLAEKLNEKGIYVDINLIDRACLLHDIARPCDFRESDYNGLKRAVTEQDKAKWQQLKAKYQGLCHEDIAYELLRKKYPELASAVKKHRYMAILDEQEKPTSWEEKLVYYADKRIMHDRIVPLKERLEEAHKRNVHLHGTQNQSDINPVRKNALSFPLRRIVHRTPYGATSGRCKKYIARVPAAASKAPPELSNEVNTNKVDPLIFELEEEIFNKIDLNPLEVTNELVN